jgi:hypothetical protein
VPGTAAAPRASSLSLAAERPGPAGVPKSWGPEPAGAPRLLPQVGTVVGGAVWAGEDHLASRKASGYEAVGGGGGGGEVGVGVGGGALPWRAAVAIAARARCWAHAASPRKRAARLRPPMSDLPRVAMRLACQPTLLRLLRRPKYPPLPRPPRPRTPSSQQH